MAKIKKTRISFPTCVLSYPSLHKPDVKFNAAGVYHTKIVADPDDAKIKEIIATLESVRDEFRDTTLKDCSDKKKLAKLKDAKVKDVFTQQLDDEGEPTGKIEFSSKLNASYVDKDKNTVKVPAPAVVDAKRNKITKQVWSGSEGRVVVDAFGYHMESTNEFGISMRLVAVQVTKLVSGGADPNSLFDEVDGYVEEETAPVDGASDESPSDAASPDGDY